MKLLVKCPFCKHQFLEEKTALDRRITCLNCNRIFKVPPPEEYQQAENIVKKAKSNLYVDKNGKTYG